MGYDEEQNEKAIKAKIKMILKLNLPCTRKWWEYISTPRFARKFQNRVLGMKKVFIADKEMSLNSLDPKWDDYIVIEVVGSGTYELAKKDGKSLRHPWNSM